VKGTKILISGDWWTFRRKNVIRNIGIVFDGEPATARSLLLGLTELENRRITISNDLRGMDYLKIVIHEGLHAILSSNPNIPSFYELNGSELEVDILAKELAGYLRQIVGIRALSAEGRGK